MTYKIEIASIFVAFLLLVSLASLGRFASCKKLNKIKLVSLASVVTPTGGLLHLHAVPPLGARYAGFSRIPHTP
jgi:hypothetical protein